MEEEIKNEDVVEETVETVEETAETPKKTPTQDRVERAERQKERAILNELGAESLDEVKDRLAKVEEMQEQLVASQQETTRRGHISELRKRLQEKNAFDPDVLIPFINSDELDGSKESYDKANEKLVNDKQQHCGVKQVTGDGYKPSNQEVKVNKVKEYENKGDYQSAIAQMIRDNY